MEKLFIIIPAYNEEANIENTVREWYPVIKKHNGDGRSRLVVVNDGSTDHTWKILSRLPETMPLLSPLKKKNGGHGSSVLYGYRYAIDKGADFIFQTDADGQTNPAEFEAFWELRQKHDAVIGWKALGDFRRLKKEM